MKASNCRNAILIHPSVKEAKDSKVPLVAVESAIITHGLPFPDNYNLAIAMEEAILEENCHPVTMGIIDGRLNIGLTREQLSYLAELDSPVKTSVRDMAYLMALKKSGGLTAAATMYACKLAQIDIMVTGGIGGIHKNHHIKKDISADLIEISRNPVAVVCSGTKSIFDVANTLEFLETHGVPVLNYGVKNFPTFFTRDQGPELETVVEDPHQVARFLTFQRKLSLNSGVIIANPIDEEFALSNEEISHCEELVYEEISNKSIRGKGITPFMLKKIDEITKGKSTKANKNLLLSNAKLAAVIASTYYNGAMTFI